MQCVPVNGVSSNSLKLEKCGGYAMKYEKIARKITLFLTLVLVGVLCPVFLVKADVEKWMEEAQIISLNQNVSGTAKNNHNPTGMDPYYFYREYFCFSVPFQMDVYFSESISGSEKLPYIYISDSQGKGVKLTSTGWKYSRANNQSSIVAYMTLKKGEYYIRQSKVYDKNTESHPYTIKVTAKLSQAPKMVYAKRISSKSAKVKWKKVSRATGYEIYRSTSFRTSFKLIKRVNGKTSSITTKDLKKGKRYYYRVRAYRIWKGMKFYSDPSWALGC